MVQAGRLVEIEQALANLGSAPPPTPVKQPPPARPPTPEKTGPSPFELDRAKKAAIASTGDINWREQLHAALTELNMAFTADAVEHSSFALVAGELQVTTPLEFKMMMNATDY